MGSEFGRRESDDSGVIVPKWAVGAIITLFILLLGVASSWGILLNHVNDESRHYSVTTIESRISRNEQDIQRMERAVEELGRLRADLAEIRAELREVGRAVGVDP